MYTNVTELINKAEEDGLTILDVIINNEAEIFQTDREKIYKKMEKTYEVMLNSVNAALKKPIESKESLIYKISLKQNEYAKSDNTVCGSFINKTMALALSAAEMNSTMGKVCAAPTAGSCGVVPAVIISLGNKYNFSKKERLEGLMVAGGIGAVLMRNATVSGAEGGCQAECGAAAIMAAAATVYLRGGSNKQIENSIVFTIINMIGLICDSIAGQVQVPCAQRNASQAVNALISADMALAGMPNTIPADEAIEAMYKVGHQLPAELKETSMGGIARTKTGIRIAEEFIKKHKSE